MALEVWEGPESGPWAGRGERGDAVRIALLSQRIAFWEGIYFRKTGTPALTLGRARKGKNSVFMGHGMMKDLEFFRGLKEIATFLGVHPKTCARYLRQGKIPAKRDGLGKWVLCTWDYYRELRRMDDQHS